MRWDCSADELRKAYFKIAREEHPDRQGEFADSQGFQKLQGAYELLSDPKKRELYDFGEDYGDSVEHFYYPTPDFRPFQTMNPYFDVRGVIARANHHGGYA